jgi:hypothetical protein
MRAHRLLAGVCLAMLAAAPRLEAQVPAGYRDLDGVLTRMQEIAAAPRSSFSARPSGSPRVMERTRASRRR